MDKIDLIKLILCETDKPKCSSLENNEFDFFSNDLKDKYVIVRTYSAGVFAGYLRKKEGDEVILESSRRLYRWQTKKSISLSSVAMNGLASKNSRVCEPLPIHWCQAIEIIPTSKEAEKNIVNFEITTQD
jgi:hypothetical protein